jgi:hypothetical protein
LAPISISGWDIKIATVSVWAVSKDYNDPRG